MESTPRPTIRTHGDDPDLELVWLLCELRAARARKLACFARSAGPERDLLAHEVTLLEAWILRLSMPLMGFPIALSSPEAGSRRR